MSATAILAAPAAWTTVTLGDLLKRRKDEVYVEEMETYKRLTIRLNGKGIAVRDIVKGSQIGTKLQFSVKPGQFILSKIDARNGAFGVIPSNGGGAIITGNFWVFDIDTRQIDSKFIEYLTKTHLFIDFCIRASEGTTNRLYLQENAFLSQQIPLPPLEEQRRIVARIEELSAKISQIRELRAENKQNIQKMLLSAFVSITEEAQYRKMTEVAPLVRRPIEVDFEVDYHELGIRSFGKGTFHKPAISGASLGTKRIFSIEPKDLVFNNVFAWEGAVAVAKEEDKGRVGSHRFITCVAKPGITTPQFLYFYFLTSRGLKLLGEASPGGAGRNRTLNIKDLEQIEVPIPCFDKQLWFDELQGQIDRLRTLQEQTAAEIEALLPAILDKAFKGEL
jgi:type I restriction enzyme, S subunit